MCAKEFGWTPSETDEQPAYLIDWLLAITATVKKVESDHFKSETS